MSKLTQLYNEYKNKIQKKPRASFETREELVASVVNTGRYWYFMYGNVCTDKILYDSSELALNAATKYAYSGKYKEDKLKYEATCGEVLSRFQKRT